MWPNDVDASLPLSTESIENSIESTISSIERNGMEHVPLSVSQPPTPLNWIDVETDPSFLSLVISRGRFDGQLSPCDNTVDVKQIIYLRFLVMCVCYRGKIILSSVCTQIMIAVSAYKIYSSVGLSVCISFGSIWHSLWQLPEHHCHRVDVPSRHVTSTTIWIQTIWCPLCVAWPPSCYA